MPPNPPSDRRPNRLAGEKSPYLLQHAHNPVDWHPWGEEAFARARVEDKPIFLSIGYSTCHWCHVMERESFESDAVAEPLNRWFVPIKVDREERPDVDRIYMTAMQALGLGGGWPLNVFLTPELEPFFGGTYFPPDAAFGRPGLLQVLPRVHEAWLERRGDLEDTGRRVLAALADLEKPEQAARDELALLDLAWSWFERTADRDHGGFGTAPKFPSPCNLAFLTRFAVANPDRREAALRLVAAQLDAMRAGGIHDHLGGGFHRYSVDAAWRVSHFEKMLYDQAQLAWAYLEGFQITGDSTCADTARRIFTYVLRDLSSPEGGFCSAEDADSEGEEGRFYVWTPTQLEEALGAEDASLFARRYGVTPQGNFEHGASVLYEARTVAELARERKLDEAALEARLDRAADTLLAARSRRTRPHLDDKVLAAWNGLMISACARGARVLNDGALAERGARAGEFVWSWMWNANSRELQRRWREGEAAMAGQLDDYANVALGFVDLYGATFEPKWLSRAAEITGAMIERFEDREAGGFFESPPGDDSIRLRLKDGHDGAELAGNSIAAQVVQALGVLLDRAAWREAANRAFAYYSRRLGEAPAMMPQMLVSMDLARATPRQVVIAGDPAAPDTRALIAEFDRRFLPHDLLLVTGEGARRRQLEELVPFVEPLVAKQGRATAYVCVEYACRLPVQDAAEFAAQLDEVATVVSKRSFS
ncbi:MAG TPA: thioredoxin domain-containing protein [Candidatus Sulfotelmatobacter sp.]|nr:thioredoxin domain-containing protein [Candidatus Sulfotelmatobacter sp.]